MELTPGKIAVIAVVLAPLLLVGGLIGSGAVEVDAGTTDIRDALFGEDNPQIVMVPHDGPGGQYVVQNEDGELRVDFSEAGLTRNAQLQFNGVFDLVNEDEEAVIVWVSHDSGDAIRLYDEATGQTIEGETNGISLAPNERVVVSVDVDSRGVSADQLVTTVTFSAQYDAPFFEVDITDIREEIVAGQTVDVEAEIQNVGSTTGEREVRFIVDGEVVDTANVELGPEASQTVSFAYETGPQEIPETEIAVETDHDRDERTVVVEPAQAAFFDVTIDQVPDEIDVGERLIIGATIENLGEAPEAQTIELLVDGEVVDEQTVELGGPNPSNASVELTWTPREGDEGTVEIAVRSEDDEETAEVDINAVFRAQASASSYAVTTGTEVEFRADRSLTPADVTPSYSWEIDSETYTGERVTAVMSEPGDREVRLTMTDGASGETDTDTVTIEVVDETPPSISLVVDEAVELGDSIAFDASGSTDDVEIDRFEWDFGDGATETGEEPTHTYDEPGRYVVTLSVIDTSGNEATARVEVTVRSPRGSLSADEIDFGEVGTGSAVSDTVVINNTGTTPLEMNNIDIVGSDSFEIVGDAADNELTVLPGDSRAIEVAFAPTAGSDETATLTFDSNNPDSLGSVSLTGTGLVSDLEPVESKIDFGNVAGGDSQQRTITVENVGNRDIDLTGAELTGTDSDVFEIVGGGDATLGPNETHDIVVAFEPTVSGSRTANLRVISDESTVTVALRGTGEAPQIRLDRDAIEFSTVGLGNQEDATVEIRNSGNQPLSIDEIGIGGSGSEHFWIDTNTVPETISPGETGTFAIWFEPRAAGDHQATVSIESDDPETSTESILINGPAVGAEISIDQRTIDFGVVDPGSTSYMNITIRNKQNSPADLRINATEIIGGDEDAFYINRGGAPISLSPGESLDIEVGFEPLDRGNKNSQLQILSDAGNRPVINVWLSNTRAHIIVQEIGNPIINVEGRDLVESDDYDINVWTPTIDTEPVGVNRLRFTATQEDRFETNVDHDELRSDVAAIERSERDTLQYVQLDHLEMENPDETFAGTGLRYQVSKASVPAGASPDDVTLYRWNNAGEWTNLSGQTELVEETSTHYIYEAETPGFSQFAVTVPSQDDSTSDPGEDSTGSPSSGSGPTAPSEEGGEQPGDDESGNIQTTVDFEDDGNIPTFQTREVDREEIYDLDQATADLPPQALIFPRDDHGQPLEGDRTVTVDGQTMTLSAEHTRIMLAGEPAELTGERSTVSSGDAITDRERMIGAVEISVPENRRDRPAAIQLRVDRDRFGESDPQEASIGHRTESGWELLSTEVIEITDDEVVLTAETPGFSIFGIFADPQVEYEWTLPDGNTANGPILNHTFAEPGLYEIQLRITDAFNREATATYQVLANDVPEAVIEIVDREDGEVTLAANVDNEIGETEVAWTFEDGTEMVGHEVTHTLEDGEHEVGLHVVDEFGAEFRTEQTVAVGTLPQVIADALGIDLELLIQLSLLSIIGGAIAIGYRRFPWQVLSSVRRRGPEITAFETPVINVATGQCSIETLTVVDGGSDLESIAIEVNDDEGTVVRKQLDVSGRVRYSAAPETLVIPPGVEIESDREYAVRVEAIDARNRTAEESETALTATSTPEIGD